MITCTTDLDRWGPSQPTTHIVTTRRSIDLDRIKITDLDQSSTDLD